MKTIRAIVVYALPDVQYIQEVEVKLGSTIKDAILASKILTIVKNLKFYKNIGVYNKITHLHSKIKDGDRVEIYRYLIIDPKERRRKNSFLLKNKKI